MSMEWSLETVQHVAVLSITGPVSGPETNRRLVSGVAWTSAHSTGPLVLDLSGLRRWSPAARAALAAAVGGWARDDRTVLMCLPAWANTAKVETDFSLASLHPDRASAVAAALACPAAALSA
jgi:hypothetical protein